jgi:hypothetical protein
MIGQKVVIVVVPGQPLSHLHTPRSRIHERAISWRFLAIILFPDLRFLYGFLKPQGRGYGVL